MTPNPVERLATAAKAVIHAPMIKNMGLQRRYYEVKAEYVDALQDAIAAFDATADVRKAEREYLDAVLDYHKQPIPDPADTTRYAHDQSLLRVASVKFIALLAAREALEGKG